MWSMVGWCVVRLCGVVRGGVARAGGGRCCAGEHHKPPAQLRLGGRVRGTSHIDLTRIKTPIRAVPPLRGGTNTAAPRAAAPQVMYVLHHCCFAGNYVEVSF